MTQFKDKSAEQEFVSAGLFNYPVLMAGDILLYQADIVPVGDDQRQHVELARNIAERFNSRYGDTFTVPRGVYPEEGARIRNLQEPERLMSTSAGNPQGVVRLVDEPDVVRRKFKTAVTDSERDVRHEPATKAGISNLIEIMSVATGESIPAIEASLRRRRVRRLQERRRRGCGGAPRSDPGALRAHFARTSRSCGACSPSARTRPATPRRRRSRRCTSAWASSASGRRSGRGAASRARRPRARATRPAPARRGRVPRTHCGAGASPGGRPRRTSA